MEDSTTYQLTVVQASTTDFLLLAAHLPCRHLAVLAVAVALGLALASLPLNLANFLGLGVAVLPAGRSPVYWGKARYYNITM